MKDSVIILIYLVIQKSQVSWEQSEHWIPAFAGMTECRGPTVIPAKAGIQPLK
jgi:hypothetical protein